MNNKELIRRFYEVVVSGNLLDEIPQYISEDCMLRTGDDTTFIADGRSKHSLDFQQIFRHVHAML